MTPSTDSSQRQERNRSGVQSKPPSVVVLVSSLEKADELPCGEVMAMGFNLWLGFALKPQSDAVSARGVRRHQLVPDLASTATRHRLVRGARLAVTQRLSPGSPRHLRSLLRNDRWFRRVAGDADLILVDDVCAEALAGMSDVMPDGVRVVALDAMPELMSSDRAARHLDQAVRRAQDQKSFTATALENVAKYARRLSGARVSLTGLDEPNLIEFALRLAGSPTKKGTEALESLHDLGPDGLGVAWSYVAGALAQSELTLNGSLASGSLAATDTLFSRADELSVDDLTKAGDAAWLGLRLLLHRELHSDTLASSVVNDPSYLQSWQASNFSKQLLSNRQSLEPLPDHDPTRPLRVMVLAGAFPNFYGHIVSALSDPDRYQVHVEFLRTQNPQFGAMGPAREAIQWVTGVTDWPVDEEVVDRLRASDVVIADWADAGAAWASRHVAPHTRLIIRAHSVDLLQPWMSLIDWARVDHLTFGSKHTQVLGQRFVSDSVVPQHVIPELMSFDTMAREKDLDARFTVVMIGWAQRVKDPLWALEVMARLVAVDPRYRLLLVGNSFAARQPFSGAKYKAAYESSELRQSLAGNIEEVGYVSDIPGVLQSAGFILSASRREGFSIGLVEGMASGSVPVVRDWPLFAPLNGAGSVFGEHNVVQTPQEAAEHILALSEPDRWLEASHAAREQAQTIARPQETRDAIRRLVG